MTNSRRGRFFAAHGSPYWLVALLAVSFTSAGCQRSVLDGTEASAGTAGGGRIELLRVVAWPGGGLQLTAARRDDSGRAVAFSAAGPARMLRADRSELALASAVIDARNGLTAIWIAPTTDVQQHAARLAAARALLEGLPTRERVGIWLASDRLPLLAELSERREHIQARIDAIAPAAALPLDPGAQERAIDRMMEVSGVFGPIHRSLVIVGAVQSGPERAPRPQGERVGLLLAQLTEQSDEPPNGSTDRVFWHEHRTPAEAAAVLAERIAKVRASTTRIGACGNLTEGEPLLLEAGGEQLQLYAPAPLAEFAADSCEPGAAADDLHPFPDTVELDLTADELALHDRYDADQDEREFSLSVRLGDRAPVPARAHFRGRSSLACDRKSYSIHFADDQARRILPGASADEFYLLSLCNDRGFFRQVLASRLMARLGLFSLEQRYVRLRVAGRERGVYLLVEKPDQHLRKRQAELSALVRRRMDPDGEPPELKYPQADREPAAAERALAEYQSLHAPIDQVAPEALYAALSRRIDFDNYLRWLALQTFLQCGDYVGETFFYASDETAASDGEWYFRNLGWDTDALFTACHEDGRKAHDDPHGIVYCAEGDLDRALFVSPDIYARFAEQLAVLIGTELDPERVVIELDQVRDQLFARLQDDAVCLGSAGTIDGQPASCAVLRPWIQNMMVEFGSAVRERAGRLEQQLDSLDRAR